MIKGIRTSYVPIYTTLGTGTPGIDLLVYYRRRTSFNTHFEFGSYGPRASFLCHSQPQYKQNLIIIVVLWGLLF